MLHKQAIVEFLNRKVDSHTWIKGLSDDVLDEEIASLRPKPQFTAPLLKHQKACLLLGIAWPELFLQLEMGLGKTRLCLELINFFLLTKQHLFLILCPTDEVALGWRDEIEKWTPNLPFQLMLGSREEKWQNLSMANSGVVIGTYVGIATLVSDLVDVETKSGKAKREWQPNKELVNRLTERLTGLILDEATKVKTHTSLSYDVANKVSKAVSIRYALAGRPFGRNPLDLWAQFFLVDRGQTLSPTLGLFREAFFHKKAKFWGGPYSFDYIFDKKLTKDLARITGHRSIQYSADECDQLPELVRITKRVVFPPENLEYYDKIVKQMIAAKGNLRETKNAFLRLRQLSSGFLGLIDDETNDRVEINFKTNPKLNLLLELIEDTPDDKKCIVFHEFNYSGRIISEALKERKIKHDRLWSGTKNWEKIKDAFDHDPKFKALIVNSKKGSFGLNLQAANYCFYYESPVSAIDRSQSEKRFHRTGQKQRCFLYDLVVRGTVDERILDYLQEGEDLFSAVIKDPRKLLRS